jgi:hypothetical protein
MTSAILLRHTFVVSSYIVYIYAGAFQRLFELVQKLNITGLVQVRRSGLVRKKPTHY